MPNRQIRRPFAGSRKRRGATWTAVTSVNFTSVPAASKVLLGSLTAAQLLDIAPATLVRIRGRIMWNSDQTAADELQLGAVGFGIVQDVARAAGAASIPGPTTDPAANVWVSYQGLAARGRVGIVAGGEAGFLNFEFDSKAMRKLTDDEALVIMVENSHATHGAEITMFARMLFLLN